MILFLIYYIILLSKLALTIMLCIVNIVKIDFILIIIFNTQIELLQTTVSNNENYRIIICVINSVMLIIGYTAILREKG